MEHPGLPPEDEPEAGTSAHPGGEYASGDPENSCAGNGPEDGGSGAVDGNGNAGAAESGTAEAGGSVPEEQAPDTEQSTLERIAVLEAQAAEANDNYLRKAADFENYRKRMNQEKQSAIDYANQTLLLDLVSVIDDFERAIKAAETQREAAGNDPGQIAASFSSLREGIGMIEKNLVSQLENKWGLKRFDSAGEPFDPNRHEAIMMEKSADLEEPVVAEDFIKGYILKDRVIRPAKVKVVMPEK
ncbi:MAG: nucleotide exchange factor GrpE [Treponema sp.]|jgi:molecular chaperone GrpE|nr:nucleotide exchange factor GrpE [Treponema sp.]